ncbi:MAG: alpha/beta hydrolase [Pseudomonadota bacterium]
MKVADLDVVLLAGWTAPSHDLWLSRWTRQMRTARFIEQADWETPQIDDWIATIEAAVSEPTSSDTSDNEGIARKPLLFIAHSCGVTAFVRALPRLPRDRIAGAFLVAPPDLATSDIWPATHGGFREMPLDPLNIPAIVIASSNDPYCDLARARTFAEAWGAAFKDVGAAGHINTASGHGPWPEGTLALAHFLKAQDGPSAQLN